MKLHPAETHEAPKMTKPRIIKNVVVLSSGVLVLFTAYDGLTMLQSTMNGSQGLGVASQAVLYFCFCISALIFPKYVIKRLGSKLTLILSMASYIPYVASNFYPQWSVMIPTSVLLGFGAALLWGSQANYLNDVSVMYAELLVSKKRAEIESGKNFENDSEVNNGTERMEDNNTNIKIDKTQRRMHLETGNGNENKTISERGGIESGRNTETESSMNGKRRKTSITGCRCISCVYVKYENTDTYLLENQLETEKRRVKSSQESVSTNFDALALGQPLSSSKCHMSAGNPSQEQPILEVFKQDCMNEKGFKNQNSKLKDQNIVLNTVNGECMQYCNTINDHGNPNVKSSISKINKQLNAVTSDTSLKPDTDSKYEIYNNIANLHKQGGKELNAKTDKQDDCNSGSDKENRIVSNRNSPPKPKVDTSNSQTTAKENDMSNKKSTIQLTLNNTTYLAKPMKSKFDSAFEKETIKPNQNLFPQQTNSTERKRAIESTTARFFGIHGLFFLSSSIWSNLMSYGVLHSRQQQTSTYASANATCGVDFCGFESQEHQQRHQPSDETRYALTGVCVALGVASVALVATFLDALDDKNKEERFSLGLLTATLALAKRGKLLMLMPLSFYLGMAKGFYTADFTKAFVGCAWGTTHVGLVTVCYGAACALSSVTSGVLVRRAGRAPIFAAAALANAGASALMLTWTPRAEEPLMLFGVAALWGCHAGTVWSQIRAFYGVLYKADEEAAFATFHTWYSLGFCLSFAYSEFLCTYVKICVLLVTSTVGYIGYFIVERKHSQKTNK